MTRPHYIFHGAENLKVWLSSGALGTWFGVLYGACIIFVFIVSLAGPIDRAMFYFKTSSVFFSLATLSTIGGIAYLELNAGLWPQMQIYDTEAKAWYPCYDGPVPGQDPVPITHFHVLLISTIIMLIVYVTPMLVRPVDFIQNAHKYIVGLFTYFLMMPVFITCMTVYSWCNLHDISWGNRPAVADTGQLASHAAKQKKMLENYQMFRVNAFCFWVFINIGFVLTVESVMNNSNALALNDGDIFRNPIELFSVFMAALAVFRITFGTLHVIRMKC